MVGQIDHCLFVCLFVYFDPFCTKLQINYNLALGSRRGEPP